jgi:3-dehydroquinate synthase
VKNGVNYFGKKNFLGSFAPPLAVFNDELFLTTLSERNWRSGIAEAVKVALIRDAAFFSWIEANTGKLSARDMPAMNYLIRRCAELHLQHIAGGDPFETGSSRPLDFGHWSAHKLEQLTGFDILHGEAVAMGIALDTQYSFLSGRLEQSVSLRIVLLLKVLGFAITHPLM